MQTFAPASSIIGFAFLGRYHHVLARNLGISNRKSGLRADLHVAQHHTVTGDSGNPTIAPAVPLPVAVTFSSMMSWK